jgi:hypothetical protein
MDAGRMMIYTWAMRQLQRKIPLPKDCVSKVVSCLKTCCVAVFGFVSVNGFKVSFNKQLHSDS